MPSYSPGLPMLMAAAKAIAGECAWFLVVPLTGGVLVFATYMIGRRIGRPLVGLAAAWIVATSPTMLFMLMAPMSDVPAAAAWAVAVACALSETPLSALGAGIATAVAILIRPNLVPLAAVLALWIAARHHDELNGREDRKGAENRQARFAPRSLRALRSSIFVVAASCGAIAIAVINARLYGSPLASGYGDLSDAYSWSYVLPNVRRYFGWLLSAETPLAVAGLVCLFLPLNALWPARESRPGRWLLAAFAAGVWASYLIYVPWDVWWYLRFLLPAWPMMAIGTAALLAAFYNMPLRRTPRAQSPQRRDTFALLAAFAFPVFRIIVVSGVIVFGILSVRRAAELGTFDEAHGEAKYVEVAKAIESITSPDDVIISGQFSGSIRYYAGRLTLRWDWLDPKWLDRAVEWLAARGHHVYLVLEQPEVEPFRSRFAAANDVGRVNWVPLVWFRRRSIQLFDAVRRDRFAPPIMQPPLRTVRECLPQKPPPGFRIRP